MHPLRMVALILAVSPALGGCGSGTTAGKASAVAVADPAASPGERVENPLYTSWSGFKKGTSVKYREVTASAGGTKSVLTKTYTLTDLTPELATVEMQVTTHDPDGKKTENPPLPFKNVKMVTLPPGTKKSEMGKAGPLLEEGAEAVQLAGKQYKTTWYKTKGHTEAGELLIQIWSSGEVPGGLVKSVSRLVDGRSTTTVELVEVKIP